ncbi:hypothetical protein BpHYR1_050957 [Brachionus plicatilis]|uniref:Uncharacterized protein n=1 Tax=Brachionus plicatilis TaxID=10195 RepID=A0A3M7QXQ1_BRAPC|nr:hypothetical protein BpHYR1_050957 [Brachionus plicatilis]
MNTKKLQGSLLINVFIKRQKILKNFEIFLTKKTILFILFNDSIFTDKKNSTNSKIKILRKRLIDRAFFHEHVLYKIKKNLIFNEIFEE